MLFNQILHELCIIDSGSSQTNFNMGAFGNSYTP
jgi:hypothetical protein